MLERVGRGPLNTHWIQAVWTVVGHAASQRATDATSQSKSLSFSHQITTVAVREVELLWFSKKQMRQSGNRVVLVMQ